MSVLKIEKVNKAFPGTLALNQVCCQFESGKVNALVGKNGSGKSTLVKIINGTQKPSEGRVLFNEKELTFSSPADAQSQGIATVYQELSLIPGLTVAENIRMGRFKMKGKLIDWKQTYAEAQEILSSMGITVNPRAQVSSLSMWQCQMVEIAKAMSSEPKVLLLDEPTSSLAQHETQILFELIQELKKRDVIIVYISHRLQELWEICDTCHVLRDGNYIGAIPDMKAAAHEELLHMMFGDTKVKKKPNDLMASDEVVLKVEKLTRKDTFQDVSFELKKGEVLGIAGMLGSGRTELLRAIFGSDMVDSGVVTVEGNQVAKASPEIMKNMGLAMTPEDRKFEGLNQVQSIQNNLCVASLKKLSGRFFMKRGKEEAAAAKQMEELQIKASGPEQSVMSLSGGNQQKVIVGNWLNTDPKIMLFDEPSRGIDVNAKQQIFEIIWKLSKKGVSSIVVSSELEELLEVCQRILIMRGGRITGEIMADQIQISQLYTTCMGGTIEV
ncbi:MAG: sugar ABC transporter ATP-binding protein [Lachnospiraceae bacterium]|nr:sugar ABC transporter ATP-binding protein [Lachnospiraceae bacterium]